MGKRVFLFLAVIVLAYGLWPDFSAGWAETGNRITRLDGDGYLYFMEYTEDYYGEDVTQELVNKGFIDAGCSAFFTHNLDGDPLTCRNYDYPHHVSRENRNITGLNVVLHCKPEGKYESIAMADAVYIDRYNPLLQQGGPDKDGFEIGMLRILPYECIDGINEKGLCVSFFKVDLKEDEEHGKIPISISMLLRYMLDDCANVEEAVEIVGTAAVTPEDWQDDHLFVTDSSGKHVVIESRNGVVSVVDADIVTNFFLSTANMKEDYSIQQIFDNAVHIPDEAGKLHVNPAYSEGYYHRFVAIAAQLECYQDRNRDERYTSMPESCAKVILQSVAQSEYTKSTKASATQFSVIYNNREKTLEVWLFRNYTVSYRFDVKGTRIR